MASPGVSNLIPPPPRLTGNANQDTVAIIQWLNSFYTIGILANGLTQTNNLPGQFTTLLKQQFAGLFNADYPVLAALAALTTAADKVAYYSAKDTPALASLTAFARTVLAAADANAAKVILGLDGGISASVTTAGLVGKTMTFSAGGILTGFA